MIKWIVVIFEVDGKQNFDYVRDYLAAFCVNSFRQFDGRSRTSCEVWLKNEGLPKKDSLYELYI